MAGIIQLLPNHVANQIAAGEVVQRPASVVKELLENAVDAQATVIKLLLKDAGKTLIQVIDNGQGMNVTDARLCFERHATSKIKRAEDLFSLHTKGFRGEALASIAAIAHVEMKTRQVTDEVATHVVIEGSRFVSQEAIVAPIGTSFMVKNLFFNIPARRNFLKSDAVELRHCVDEFFRVAMAHPAIHFSFYHNGSDMFNLPPSNVRQRIVNLFAGKTNEKLVPVKEDTEIVNLEGFVTKPEFAKKNRGEQFFFVNDRFIKSGYLHHAVLSAYEGLLKDGAQPGYFLFLRVPPNSIDINIHPTKTEIKFDDEQALYAILRASIKHGLGQFNIAPILDFDRDANLDVPYHYTSKAASMPAIEIDPNFNPFSDDKTPKKRVALNYGKTAGAWESLYIGLKAGDTVFSSDEIAVEKLETTPSLFDDSTEKQQTRSYQIQKKYLVSSIKSGLVIIDQKRAHQRILYEKFLAELTIEKVLNNTFLFPKELVFAPADINLLVDAIPALEGLGFAIEVVDRDKIMVTAAPANLSENQITAVLEQLLKDLHDDVPGISFSQTDSIAKSMSRSMAVKYGIVLTEPEQEHIVNSLFACKEPAVSPFGKPTFITLSVDEIDKKFSI